MGRPRHILHLDVQVAAGGIGAAGKAAFADLWPMLNRDLANELIEVSSILSIWAYLVVYAYLLLAHTYTHFHKLINLTWIVIDGGPLVEGQTWLGGLPLI